MTNTPYYSKSHIINHFAQFDETYYIKLNI